MNHKTPLILASASPRRRELLSYLGIPFTVLPSRFGEVDAEPHVAPTEHAVTQALNKARDVYSRHPEAAVLGADTIVVLDGQILGKPLDPDEAWAMLRSLRGRSHSVITGLALVADGEEFVLNTESLVEMRQYSDDEIEAYIARGEPFDKAGSYAIQDQRFKPVKRLIGCYCNVVGLPLVPTRRTLESAKHEFLTIGTPGLPAQCKACPMSAYTSPPEQFPTS